MTFAHIDGLKISTDKSTLFSKLELRLITDDPRNKDACIVDGMIPIHFHVDLPSTFGGQVNVTLSCQMCKSCRFCMCDTFKYPSINDITRENHGLIQGEVNVSGSEQGIPIYFTQTLKSESFQTSQLR